MTLYSMPPQIENHDSESITTPATTSLSYAIGNPDRICLDTLEQTVYQFAETNLLPTGERNDALATRVRQALKVIEEAIERYGCQGVALSFNGGKDCTVLLHLWAAVIVRYLKRQDPASTLSIEQRIRNLCIPAVYVCAGDPFPEVEAFTEHYIRVFGVVLHREQGSMRNALGCFLKVYPNIQAILVGVRRTDPYAATLRTFQMTDAGWPEFMRIHPILDWDYADIWLYLRALKIPYCSLYERGFTSLGGIHNTRPNPALRMNESHSPVSYQPAWKLTDGSKERDGRV